jgi:nicotinic acid mononucleotide adenylyltransferase
MRLREIFEAPETTAVMAFGRMNPPTIGHAKLVDAVVSQGGDPYIFLSQSQKPKTDPLAFEDKLRYAKFFFPNVTIGNPEVKTIIQALQKVAALGYANLIYVAGSDRVASFEKLLNEYNGKEYNFKSIKVVSAGERDPDADGAEGMSASKMRAAAAEGDLESFKQGVPQQEVADEMYAAVRQGMGIRDQVPAEGVTEAPDAEAEPTISLPKQIKVTKMPPAPPAPTGQDGKDENGTIIKTTQKGNRTVTNGAGQYAFNPKGQLIQYVTPKIGGLQQTHNIAKQTVTVDFGTTSGNAVIGQKATYDMSGKLISGDNTKIGSGPLSVNMDKDKGTTIDYTALTGNKHSINSKDPKRMDKLAAMDKDMEQGRAAMKAGQDAALNKLGIKR